MRHSTPAGRWTIAIALAAALVAIAAPIAAANFDQQTTTPPRAVSSSTLRLLAPDDRAALAGGGTSSVVPAHRSSIHPAAPAGGLPSEPQPSAQGFDWSMLGIGLGGFAVLALGAAAAIAARRTRRPAAATD
jgi:hypothetical protein